MDLPPLCSACDGKVAIFFLLERLFQVVDEIRVIAGRLMTTIREVTHGGESSLDTTKLM